MTHQAVTSGALFLDNGTGDCYRWDKARHNPKIPIRGWRVQCSIGLICNASRKEPPQPPQGETAVFDSTKTVVKRDSRHYQHWVFGGMSSIKFLAQCNRMWDVSPEFVNGMKEGAVLATSMRGTEIMQATTHFE